MQGRLDLHSSIGNYVERFDDVEISPITGSDTRQTPRDRRRRLRFPNRLEVQVRMGNIKGKAYGKNLRRVTEFRKFLDDGNELAKSQGRLTICEDSAMPINPGRLQAFSARRTLARIIDDDCGKRFACEFGLEFEIRVELKP